ncbi:MAG: sensor histidine kinase [Gemmataceae bacterium]
MNRLWLAAFGLIAGLVLGGLGWATRAALGLEHQQLAHQAAAVHAENVRLALWRLDGRLTGLLAREDGRPFDHYSAIFAPQLALTNAAAAWPAGAVIEPSPLLNADLPPWMRLHFQADADGWGSPQVLSALLDGRLRAAALRLPLDNVTPCRKALLDDLAKRLPAADLLATARRLTGAVMTESRIRLARLDGAKNDISNTIDQRMWNEYQSRVGNTSKLAGDNRKENFQYVQKDVAELTCRSNGEMWLNPRLALNPSPRGGAAAGEGGRGQEMKLAPSAEALVRMTPLTGVWLGCGGDCHLVALRLVKLDGREICQGVVLDADRLTALLAEEVQDLVPDAEVVPVKEPTPELLRRSLAALPLALDAGDPPPADDPGWTGLRVGLLLAWAAALVALLAVGLGGWSLVDLSDRRIRFVSAVTHELRTPLTTLRLYLDLLMSGMVRDEARRDEYIRTLHAETDRLARLVTNVLDFSRLEKHAPQLALAPAEVGPLLADVAATWQIRCETAGKQLVVECAPGLTLTTDACLLTQVVGNLLDNACKYSRDAGDRRVWLRARAERSKVLIDVEDRGPGVPAAERRSVFRPFRRGRDTAATTGGVGLGLALARRWTRLLGGRLTLHAPAEGGACFRVELG